MAVTITKKPTLAVTGLGAPTRGTGNNKYLMSATWKVPSSLTNQNRDDRAEQLGLFWYLGLDTADPRRKVMVGTSATSSGFNLNGSAIGSTTYHRTSFYPVTSRKLHYVTFKIMAKNSKGWGPVVTQVRKFLVPRVPTIAALAFDTERGKITTTVTTNEGVDYQERYDTRYTVTVTNPFVNGGKAKNTSDGSSTSTSIPLSYDAAQYMQLTYDQYIKIVVTAWARGFKGDSAKATRTLYVSFPAKPTIKGVDVSSRSATGKCTVRINTNSSVTHPVDKVMLQYAADVEYTDASDIPGTAWEDTEIVDNASCTALAMPVSDLLPSRGNHTWVRVVSYHLHEDILFRYSEPAMVKALETPATPAAQINIEILSAQAGEDGESAVVQLGWNADGQDDFTGTELTWSDSEDTWKSTEEPNKHEFTWTDGKIYKKTEDTSIVSGKTYYTRSGEGTDDDPYVYTAVASPSASHLDEYYEVEYNDSATITIKGLKEGSKYFIKARRYLEADNEQFSAYSSTATVFTSEAPEAIVAKADKYVAKGDPLAVYWNFAGNGIQTEWQIVDSNGTVIANGQGSAGGTQISAERLEEVAVDNSITYTVQASTGSGFVVSEEHTLTIIEQPTLSVTAPATLTAQPYSFTATTNNLCDLTVIVTSQGISGQFPEGILTQTSGDTIHSDVYAPVWTESNGIYTATVTLPDGLAFWNGGKYTLSVTATDRTTGLSSATVTPEFVVNWADPAVDPDGAVTLTPIDTTDTDGYHRLAVQLDLTPPEDCNEDDVYDIYRMDGDTVKLIGEGFPLTHTTADEYAPFGNAALKYRVALRTVDGDVSFADIEYTLPCDSLRFDWDGGSIEFPYNLAISDKYEKDVDFRQHMDGSVDGYWNPNITRTASLNTDVIILKQAREIELTRNLARYPGAVFVRTPNGNAYAADVQVSNMDSENKHITAVAIDATEVGLTQEFMLPIPEEEEE